MGAKMNTVVMHKLSHGAHIRADAWEDGAYAKLFTVHGYAMEIGKSAQEIVDQTLQLGAPLVGSIYEGHVFYNSPVVRELRQRHQLRQAARAAVLATGDIVEVDGLRFLVQFAPGSEYCTYPRNVDPVGFRLI